MDNTLIAVGRFSYNTRHISIVEYGEGARLKIGSFCAIAPSVTIFLGGNHRLDWITTFPFGHVFQKELGGEDIQGHPATKGDVVIGHDVWIGQGATIMSGVTIGNGAVIAANSHVVKNVMPYEIVGGNPAKVIRNRFSNEIKDLLLKLAWWDLPLEVIKVISEDLSVAPNIDGLNKLIALHHSQT